MYFGKTHMGLKVNLIFQRERESFHGALIGQQDGDSMAYLVNHLEKTTEQKVVLTPQVRYLQNSLDMKLLFH